jgi:hypothetical protein
MGNQGVLVRKACLGPFDVQHKSSKRFGAHKSFIIKILGRLKASCLGEQFDGMVFT